MFLVDVLLRNVVFGYLARFDFRNIGIGCVFHAFDYGGFEEAALCSELGDALGVGLRVIR